jgi:hypothetical protein
MEMHVKKVQRQRKLYTLQNYTEATKKDIETNSSGKEVLKDIFVDRERQNQ